MFYASRMAMCRALIPKLAYDNNSLVFLTTCGPTTTFDPKITGVAGTWFFDDGTTLAAASGVEISKTFASEGLHRAVYRPASGGLAAITAIDGGKLITRIDNVNRTAVSTSGPAFNFTATTTGATETVSIAMLNVTRSTLLYWGDGSVSTLPANSDTAVTHVYATAGTYSVSCCAAANVQKIKIDDAKLGGLNTSELRYSAITYFWVTLATGCTINSVDMVDWRPTTWYLYSMPAGTYSISSADMVDWRPTTWYLSSMPTADSSYSFAASCMRNWTALTTLIMNDLGLDATTIDTVLADLYAGRMGYTAAAPTATMGGSNADPTGVYQSMVPPTTGMEIKYELVNDSASQGFKKWAIAT